MDLRNSLSKQFKLLNHERRLPSLFLSLWDKTVIAHNADIAHYYQHQILRYEHIVRKVLNVPEIMDILQVIYNFMQLHERLAYKQKLGDRLDSVVSYLQQGIRQYESYVTAATMRFWRHPKAHVFAALNKDAIKMFKMSFLLRQYTT